MQHVVEAVALHPGATPTAQQLVDALRSLQPRLFSVASSPLVSPDEVHLTVETLRYTHQGHARLGVASTWLCDRLDEGGSVSVHLVPGHHFRLPEPTTDIVMVGPGTGIAPFRAFLAHREAQAATGRSWLFFGHQHEATDALYGDELAVWLERGTLTRLDCAWSRDQDDKVYVQHRIRAQGAELWQWLEGGAILYVCGDRLRMAGDVRAVFVEIAQSHGRLSADDAEATVARMESDGRYRIDVY